MARSSRLKLPRFSPAFVDFEETLGEHLACFRKERGFTQVNQRMGTTQARRDYESDKLRPHAEMLVRFALALDLTDEVLGVRTAPHAHPRIARRFLRRLEALPQLPKREQVLRATGAKGRAA